MVPGIRNPSSNGLGLSDSDLWKKTTALGLGLGLQIDWDFDSYLAVAGLATSL